MPTVFTGFSYCAFTRLYEFDKGSIVCFCLFLVTLGFFLLISP